MAKKKKDYILGTEQKELERLEIQHRIWSDAAVTAWRRAGFGPGMSIVDLGCGPGFSTLDLSQLVTNDGIVYGVDQSETFLMSLRMRAQALGAKSVQTKSGNIESKNMRLFPPRSIDGIYCRWVLCWLKNPKLALQLMAKILKPGGKVVVHDYFNWRSMCLAPRSSAIEALVAAAVVSFEKEHGNVDLGGHLMAMLEEVGFRIDHFSVHQRAARGGGVDATAAWPLTWWRTYGPKLVNEGLLSKKIWKQVVIDLNKFERNPNMFFSCPPVYEFIATVKG